MLRFTNAAGPRPKGLCPAAFYMLFFERYFTCLVSFAPIHLKEIIANSDEELRRKYTIIVQVEPSLPC